MSYLAPGRPHKYTYHEIGLIPNKPGVYRICTSDKNIKYIGLSNEVRRRAREHRHSGKFENTDYIEYLKLKPGVGVEGLREAEREQIIRHSPYANKRKGGGGPIPDHFDNYFSAGGLARPEAIDISISESEFNEIARKIKWSELIISSIVLLLIVGIFIFVKCNENVQSSLINWINSSFLPMIDSIRDFVSEKFFSQ